MGSLCARFDGDGPTSAARWCRARGRLPGLVEAVAVCWLVDQGVGPGHVDAVLCSLCGVFAARHTVRDHRNETGNGDNIYYTVEVTGSIDDEVCDISVPSRESRVTSDHIAHHDPARVLAECAARRRIVNAYRSGQPEEDRYAVGWHDMHVWSLYQMAAVYADHPDYDVAWRV